MQVSAEASINKQQPTKNNICLSILSNMSPQFHFLRSKYHSHILHIMAQKILIEVSLNSTCCRGIYLFVILPPFCTNFGRTSTIS